MKKPSSGKQLRPPKLPPKSDHLKRLAFMYQAAISLDPNSIVSRMYLRNMDAVAKKSVLKLDPTVKRTICKSCQRLQVAGVSSNVRIENNSRNEAEKNDILVITCACGKSKRYPIGKDRTYELFSAKNEYHEETQ